MAICKYLWKVDIKGILAAYVKFPALSVHRFYHPMNQMCMKKPMKNRIKHYLGKHFPEQLRSTYTLNNINVQIEG